MLLNEGIQPANIAKILGVEHRSESACLKRREDAFKAKPAPGCPEMTPEQMILP